MAEEAVQEDDLDFIDEIVADLPEIETVETDSMAEDGGTHDEVVTDEEPSEDTETSKADDEQPEVDWETRLATEEKRRKDSQAAYNTEHQKRLELEQRLAELESKANQPEKATAPTEEDLLDKYQDMFSEDPQEAIAMLARGLKEQQDLNRRELEQKLAQAQQDAYNAELIRQENAMRDQHEDYDAIVTEYLAPKMQEDPALAQQWRNNGGTASAAYNLGKTLKERDDYLSDPDSFRNKLKEELMAEINGGKPQVGETLQGINSQKARPGGSKKSLNSEDILAEVFGS